MEPVGKVSRRWYAAGYQDALADIDRALTDGGSDAVRRWIENNQSVAARVRRAVEQFQRELTRAAPRIADVLDSVSDDRRE